MPTDQPAKPSFSRGRKWGIGLNVVLLLLVVLAVVAMVNYLSREYFLRSYWSTRTSIELSPRTLKFVKSLTNQVNITLYYDREDSLYSMVVELLNQYRLNNPNLSVRTVDYLRDAGAAQKTKAQYLSAYPSDKNVVIFDCAGKTRIVDGALLATNTLEQVPNPEGKELKFRRKPIAFRGETVFTATLLEVVNPKPFMAYFLSGHGEHQIESGDEITGYLKFASFLQQNSIRVQTLELTGTNPVPSDCNLLVVAGPRIPIPDSELSKLDQYLTQGGRLLALFSSASLDRETGLEKLLADWGVRVGKDIVRDPDHSRPESPDELVISAFSHHPVVNPLLGEGLVLIQPRPIGRFNTRAPVADAPRVEAIAETGQNSFLAGDPAHKRPFPVMVAVEKGTIGGRVTEHGTTRILVAGDSVFLGNHQLDLLGNRDWAGYAVNWLLDRPELLGGLGPRPITEYTLVMTNVQLEQAEWVLLAGMPGAVLALGSLVWLRRRR
jgi:gliding motility-associatede transport system auxiliary component